MKTYFLKINMNHLKDSILSEYFKYRDAFFKVTATSLYIYSSIYRNIIPHVLIEEATYHDYLKLLVLNRFTVEDLLTELNRNNQLKIYMNIMPYLEDFYTIYVIPEYLNVINLRINDDFYLEITNRRLRSL